MYCFGSRKWKAGEDVQDEPQRTTASTPLWATTLRNHSFCLNLYIYIKKKLWQGTQNASSNEQMCSTCVWYEAPSPSARRKCRSVVSEHPHDASCRFYNNLVYWKIIIRIRSDASVVLESETWFASDCISCREKGGAVVLKSLLLQIQGEMTVVLNDDIRFEDGPNKWIQTEGGKTHLI